MKVLITGANGYIGRHVVKEFLKNDYETYVLDISCKNVDTRAHILEEPLFSGDKDIYSKLCEPDMLVHLAWREGFNHNSDVHMHDLPKHIDFLQNMIDGGLKNLTVMGSMHEVGYWEGMVDENTPCNPLSRYGIAKNSLRQYLELVAKEKKISLHWLRGFYIYGDDKYGSSIFAKLWKAVDEGKTKFPFTTGKNKYDFIHIDELAQQIMCASVQTKINGIINVCTGHPIPLADKVETYIRENNMGIELEYGAFPDRIYDSPEIWGSIEKIQKIMGDVRHETIQ